MFHSGDSVLWVEHLCLLTPNIGNISIAKLLYFCLIWPKNIFLVGLYIVFSPGCPSNFSLAWSCLFFRIGVFLGLQSRSPFLYGTLVFVFMEISIPDLIKSFTSVLAVVLGSLETSLNSFLYKVFEIFRSLLLFSTVWASSNFLIILLTAVLDTLKHLINV